MFATSMKKKAMSAWMDTTFSHDEDQEKPWKQEEQEEEDGTQSSDTPKRVMNSIRKPVTTMFNGEEKPWKQEDEKAEEDYTPKPKQKKRLSWKKCIPELPLYFKRPSHYLPRKCPL